MTEDWAAVASAINQRSAELGFRQRDLIERSRVSKAVVGEIARNVVQRRRNTRTLEALSLALDWHPQHLTAVLHGRVPPSVGEPIYRFDDDDVPARLAAIEHQLRAISERLDEIASINDRLDDMRSISRRLEELNANLATVVRDRRSDRERTSR
ncbi:MAG: transcriptional regulator [Actinophytocola sp.]|uniref:transcriptional regulator n=1 Tax=Actinophytocola sp. TaxID=1872138 RepID=UPI003C7603A3